MNVKRQIYAVIAGSVLLCICFAVFVHILSAMPLGYLGRWFHWFVKTHALFTLLFQTAVVSTACFYFASIVERQENRLEKIASEAELNLPPALAARRLDDDTADPANRLRRTLALLSSELRETVERARCTERRLLQQSEDLKSENECLKRNLSLCCERSGHYRKHITMLLGLSREGIVRLDADMNVTFVNRAFLRANASESGDVLFKHFFDVVRIDREEASTEPPPIRRAIEDGVTETFDRVWLASATGKKTPMSVVICPVEHQGKRTGTLLIFTDLTESTHGYRLARALFENTAEGFVFFSEDFEPIDCNEALVRLFGAASKEEVLRHFEKFSKEQKPGAIPRESLDEMQQIVAREGRASFEWVHIDADGREIPCCVTIFCVLLGDEKFYISNVRDVSAQREAELGAETEMRYLEEIIGLDSAAIVIVQDGVVQRVNGVNSESADTGDLYQKLREWSAQRTATRRKRQPA